MPRNGMSQNNRRNPFEDDEDKKSRNYASEVRDVLGVSKNTTGSTKTTSGTYPWAERLHNSTNKLGRGADKPIREWEPVKRYEDASGSSLSDAWAHQQYSNGLSGAARAAAEASFRDWQKERDRSLRSLYGNYSNSIPGYGVMKPEGQLEALSGVRNLPSERTTPMDRWQMNLQSLARDRAREATDRFYRNAIPGYGAMNEEGASEAVSDFWGRLVPEIKSSREMSPFHTDAGSDLPTDWETIARNRYEAAQSAKNEGFDYLYGEDFWNADYLAARAKYESEPEFKEFYDLDNPRQLEDEEIARHMSVDGTDEDIAVYNYVLQKYGQLAADDLFALHDRKKQKDEVKANRDAYYNRMMSEYGQAIARTPGAQATSYDPNLYTGDDEVDVILRWINGEHANRATERAAQSGPANPLNVQLPYTDDDPNSHWEKATEEQKRTVNYLAQTGQIDKLKSYLNVLGPALQAEEMAEFQEINRKVAEENPVVGALYPVLGSPYKGISAIGQTLDMLKTGTVDNPQKGSINVNSDLQKYTIGPSVMRQEQVSEIAEYSPALAFLYQSVASSVDSRYQAIASSIFSAAGVMGGVSEWAPLIMMGGGAMADEVLAGKRRGLSDKEAYLRGLSAGLIEILTEKISLEMFLNPDFTDGIVSYLAKSGLAEGSEEWLSSWLNNFADSVITGDQSEIKTRVRELLSNGEAKDEKQAYAMVYADLMKESGLEALGGFIGGEMFAGANVISDVRNGGPVQRAIEKASNADDFYFNPGRSSLDGAKAVYDEERRYRENPGLRVQEARERIENAFKEAKIETVSDAAKQMIVESYVSNNSGQDAKQFVRDLALAYNNGLSGANIEDAIGDTISPLTSRALVDQLYRAGQIDAEANNENRIAEHKKEQLSIIQNAEEKSAYGVRSLDDIMTFEEAVNEMGMENIEALAQYEEAGYTVEQIRNALDSGEIEVYSVGGLKDGKAVYLSEREAIEEADGAQVVPYTVPTSDVAWLSYTQGQWTGGEVNGRSEEGARNIEVRNEGLDTGRSLRVMEEGSGRASGQAAEGVDRPLSEIEGVLKESGSLNVEGQSVKIYSATKNALPADVRKAVELTEKAGHPIDFYFGDIGKGTKLETNGFVLANGRIGLRADVSPYVVLQTASHELGHFLIDNGTISVRDVMDRFARNDREGAKFLRDVYESAYEGSGLSKSAVYEEMVCDALRTINIYSNVVSELRDDLEPVILELHDAIEEETGMTVDELLSIRTDAQGENARYNQVVSQEITSAGTSIKQIPALFRDRRVRFGKTNIDIGGGKYDLATNYLKENGTTNMVFDPYNRSADTNKKVIDYLTSGKRADTATCANVLNVIAEKEARENVILEVAKSIKPDGTAYFMVYEGDGSGVGKRTSAGYQNNLKTAEYVSEIKEYFDDVSRYGKLIVAKDPKADLPAASWEIEPGNAVRFSRVATDSEGRELTKYQQEYFADSKIRDEQGRLIPMYHGTDADFNVFNFDRGGEHGRAEGFGIYLANEKEVSEKYGGRVIEAYVNITHPASSESKTITAKELKPLLRAVSLKEAEDLFNNEWGYKSRQAALRDTFLSNYVYTYDKTFPAVLDESAKKIVEICQSDMDIVQEVMSGLGIRSYDEALPFYDTLTETMGIDGFTTKWNGLTTIALAFRSDQVKNIDNKTPTSDPDIRFSRTAAPEFYSKLEREIEGIKGDKIGSSSVVPYLKGKGVKDEEIKWTGINTFLEGKKSVPKADLLQYVRDNQIQIEEETLGEGVDTNNFDEYVSAQQKITDDAEFEALKLGLPIDDIQYDFDNDVWTAYIEKDGKKQILSTMNTRRYRWDRYSTPFGENYREILYKLPGSDYRNQSMYAHWNGTRGVLAHARVQDFDVHGDKVLFVEEIQSDWHNAGAKNGYEGEEQTHKIKMLNGLIDKAKKQLSDAMAELRQADNEAEEIAKKIVERETAKENPNKLWNVFSQDGLARAMKSNFAYFSPEARVTVDEALTSEEKRFVKEYSNKSSAVSIRNTDVVQLERELEKARSTAAPDAPFRDGTYIQYVLKDLLRKAAEGNYDYLAWTTGKMQEDRWSSMFSEGYRIEYDQDIPKFLQKYGKQWGAKLTSIEIGNAPGQYKDYYNDLATIQNLYGELNPYDTLSIEETASGLGRIAQMLEDDRVAYKDAGVSEEQFESAYAVAKRLDEAYYNGEIKAGDFTTDWKPSSVSAIPITPEMKESVLFEGQPRFSRTVAKLPDNADDEARSVVTSARFRVTVDRFDRADKKLAAYSPERIEAELRSSMAEGIPDYAQDYIAWVRPRDFVNSTSAAAWRGGLYQDVQTRAEALGADTLLDKEALRREKQSPYLLIRTENDEITGLPTTYIVGHEGRHRMIALESEQYEFVPVIIHPDERFYPEGQDRYHTKPMKTLWLRGQRFRQGNGEQFFAHDIIPLSENYADVVREIFKANDTSFRFSNVVSGDDNYNTFWNEIDEIKKEAKKHADELKAEIEKQKERAEYWKGQTKQTDPRPKITEASVEKLTRDFIKRNNSTANFEETKKNVMEYATWVRKNAKLLQTDKADEFTKEALKKAADVARPVVLNTNELVNADMVEIGKELRSYLKQGNGISLSADDKRAISTIGYDNFNEYRKAHFGSIKITNDGPRIDQVWSELQDLFGKQFFPDDMVNTLDQLERLDEVLADLAPVYGNPYEFNALDAEYAVDYTSRALFQRVLSDEIKEVAPTYADKMQDRLEAAEKEASERVKAAGKKAREQRDEAVAKLKEHYKEVNKDRVRLARESADRARLLKILRRVRNRKLPLATRAWLDEQTGTLDAVAQSITKRKLRSLDELYEYYERRRAADPDFLRDDYIEKLLERRTKRQIGSARQAAKAEREGSAFSGLTQGEVQDLIEILLAFEHELDTRNKLIETQDRRDVYAMAMDSIAHVDNARGIQFGRENVPYRAVHNFLIDETLTPRSFFHRLTGYNDNDALYQRYIELDKGQREWLDYVRSSENMFRDWTNDRQYQADHVGRKAKTVTGTFGGKTVTMTRDMLISLYMHSLNDDNMRHIAYSGIELPEVEAYKKGKMKIAYENSTTVRIKPSELRAFLAGDGKLTDKEMAFAHRLQKYFTDKSQTELNKVSLALYGYEKALEENYYPIEVNKDFLKQSPEDLFETNAQRGTITLKPGFLEKRVQASTTIIGRGALDVLNSSIEKTGKFVGLAIPIRNFSKLYTAKTVEFQNVPAFRGESYIMRDDQSIRDSIKRKWGEEANEYIMKLMNDLQGKRDKESALVRVLRTFRSNYAQAVLTINASVGMKQFSSYPAAAAIVGWKPLIKAFSLSRENVSKVDPELIAKYTPLYWYRARGFSDTERGDIAQRGRHLPEALNWIQGIDLFTTRMLWKAAEYYVQDQNPNMERRTPAYYEKVADVYNEIIERTQPNYTTLQRPGNLRSDFVTTSLMMFKTQPFQNFNIVYDAFWNWRAKAQRYKIATEEQLPTAKKELDEARRGFVNSVSAVTVSAALFSTLALAWSLLRGKFRKDDEDDEKGNAALKEFIKGMGSTFAGMVPFGSDVFDVAYSLIAKEYYWGYETVISSSLNDFLQGTYNLINRPLSGKSVTAKQISDLAKSIAQLLGIPLSNALNIINIGFAWAGEKSLVDMIQKNMKDKK